jgi:hypothetical protein
MKDFKCLPKMKTGGSVSKYSAGGDVLEGVKSAMRSGKDLDPGIHAKSGKNTFKFDGQEYTPRGVEMPMPKSTGKMKIPGTDMELSPIKPKSRGEAMLLKSGGKAKRGNKK